MTDIRASDLSPNQVIVSGVKAATGNAFGCYPVTILANIPNASSMRFGNTAAELASSEWRNYAAESQWFIRTGQGSRAVLCEFKSGAGPVLETSALVPEFDASRGSDYLMPPSSAIMLGGGDTASLITNGRSPLAGVVWKQDFKESHDFWSAYPYNAGMPQWGNVFYPATHHPTGGANSGGYISTDASRWLIDTPETPDSVLALLTYPRWIMPDLLSMSLANSTVSFYLRGDALDLKGGKAYFWVICGSSSGLEARWHKTSVPLVIGDGCWGAKNTIDISAWGTPGGWVKSWDGAAGVPNQYLDKVSSWGISFRDFAQGNLPSGTLSMSNFKIELT